MEKSSVTRIDIQGCTYYLIGTAHVSSQSAIDVSEVIEEVNPDWVGVELDEERYESLQTGVKKRVKSSVGFSLASFFLSKFQNRLAKQLNIKLGLEVSTAIGLCKEKGIPIRLIDQDYRVTFNRIWNTSSGKEKFLIIIMLLLSPLVSKVSPEEVEEMRKNPNVMDEYELPSIKRSLIDERDEYMSKELYNQKATKVVAVVGAGHITGIVANLKRLESSTQPITQ